MCNLFCNMVAKPAGKWCRVYYHPHLKLSCNKSGCCKLLEYWRWLYKIAQKSHHTRELRHVAAKQVSLVPLERTTCTDFVAGSSEYLSFQQQIFASCNKTGLILRYKKVQFVLKLVWQQCCKTGFTFFFLVLEYLYWMYRHKQGESSVINIVEIVSSIWMIFLFYPIAV